MPGRDALFVRGLVTDYCAHDTVVDARSHGFDVVVLADAIRGVNAQAGDETRAIREMIERGATLFQASHTAGVPVQAVDGKPIK